MGGLTLYPVEVDFSHGRLKPLVVRCVLIFRLWHLMELGWCCVSCGQMLDRLEERILGSRRLFDRWRGDLGLRSGILLEEQPLSCVIPAVGAGSLEEVTVKAADVRR